MPPHPRMAAAQAILARALVAAFAKEPYAHGLVRWGTELHDRFLLPSGSGATWRTSSPSWTGGASGCRATPTAPSSSSVPVVGRLQVGGVAVEVRNALEPWPVLGEEPGAGGTSRFVDSSMERLEVRAEGLETERFDVLVNGRVVPLRSTGTAGEHVGGVRFRAWAPESSLQPHLGIHHPLRFDLWDRWGRRSVGACAYHVWHPEGRGYEAAPLTRFEATARRAARFTEEGRSPGPPARTDRSAPRVPAHPRPPAVRWRSPHARAGGGRVGALMQELLAECRAQDEVLRGAGLEIWLGAEPTFTDRASQDPHWLWMAEGGDKQERAAALLRDLLGRLASSFRLERPEGRLYPGEEAPRFCLGAAYVPRGGAGERWVTVAPDPGVVEVNLAPAPDLVTFAEHVGSVYAAAAAAGLSPERFRWNGHAGDSGGGGQITLGDPRPSGARSSSVRGSSRRWCAT